MGKPPVKPFTGGYYGLDRSGDQTHGGGGAYLGLYKDLLPSIVGIGASAEAYVGGYSGVSGVNGGARALLDLRSLLLKVGIDYDVQHEDTSFILSLTLPLRRGGIVGHGSQFRVDWLPGRGNSWNFGLQVPLEPHMGKTRLASRTPRCRAARPQPPRPRAAGDGGAGRGEKGGATGRSPQHDVLARPQVRPPEVSRDLARRDAGVQGLDGQADPLRPRGTRLENELRIFHDRLDLAFGLAAGASEAEAGGPGRPARRPRARGRARRGRLSVQPALRAVQETGGALGPRGAGAGALRRPSPRPRLPTRARTRCGSCSRSACGRSKSCARRA